MPAHIQDICQRKPELLHQVLAMKQQEQQQQQQTLPPQEPNPDPRHDDTSFPWDTRQTVSTPPFVSSQQQPWRVQQQPLPDSHWKNNNENDDHDDPNDDEDGERTELLRKRRVDFNMYRATS